MARRGGATPKKERGTARAGAGQRNRGIATGNGPGDATGRGADRGGTSLGPGAQDIGRTARRSRGDTRKAIDDSNVSEWSQVV